MRPAEAVLVMTTIGGIEPILKQVERFSGYEKVGNRELGIRGRHDAQIMKKLIMSLPNDMDLKDVKAKLEAFLEKSGIGKFPYLACVHRGEKDGIVNRHVHINFFQRRFEAGNSNKERLFVKKTFAEEIRGIYQEVFGFKKNEAERVRIPRQEFWKFKENREAIRESVKREVVLAGELAKEEQTIGRVGQFTAGQNAENIQEKPPEVAINETALPDVAQEERIKPKYSPLDPEVDEFTKRFLEMRAKYKGGKIENKANRGDLEVPRSSISPEARKPEISHPEPQETARPHKEANPSPALPEENKETPAKKTTVPKWEFILGQQAYNNQELVEKDLIRKDLERLSSWQQLVRTNSKLPSVATQLTSQGFTADILRAAGDPIRELKQEAKNFLVEQEEYEQARQDHAADLTERGRRLEDLAHEQFNIQPAIKLLGLSKEQKRRLEEIAEAKRNLTAGTKPAPLPPDGQKLKKKLLSLNIQQISKQVEENRSVRGVEYKKQVMIKEIKRIREQRPELTARAKGKLIEEFIKDELRKPVGTSKDGLNPRMNFSANVESAVSEYISDGSPAEDNHLSDQLEDMRKAIGRPIIEAVAKELDLDEAQVAGVFKRLSENIVESAVEEAVEQQQQERKKDRGMDRGSGYGMGRGI
jgi:hypothetical protein